MLAKQAKTLTDIQVRTLQQFLTTTRHPIRNQLILMLSLKAGLRAKEIANLTWSMVTDPEGEILDVIRLTDKASKGGSGGTVPLAHILQQLLKAHRDADWPSNGDQRVIKTARADTVSAQTIVNMFAHWFAMLGFDGCSSHSGRRTFITKAARNIGRYGGSLRDVQALARHSSLTMTQRYIEIDSNAMRRVVEA